MKGRTLVAAFSLARGAVQLWRAAREGFGPAGSLVSGLLTRAVPPPTFSSVARENTPKPRSTTMHTRTTPGALPALRLYRILRLILSPVLAYRLAGLQREVAR